jgi:hypothetical protein
MPRKLTPEIERDIERLARAKIDLPLVKDVAVKGRLGVRAVQARIARAVRRLRAQCEAEGREEEAR